MDFQALVNSTKRSDDYINATKWCQAFGKEFKQFNRKKETKDLVARIVSTDKVQKMHPVNVVSGKVSETWIHPLLAIALAKWLSPDFHVHVLSIYKRYLEGDITLADDILQRASKEDAKWLAARAEGKVSRSAFTDVLQSHGVTGFGYAQNTNAIYQGLHDMKKQELADKLQVKNPREGMTTRQLVTLSFTEELAAIRIEEANAQGNQATTKVSAQSAHEVRMMVDKEYREAGQFEF